MKSKTKIKIIDSMTGSGKTTCMIDMINNEFQTDRRFIYITPFLDEVKRIKQSVTNRTMHEPVNLGYGKLDNLKSRIVNQQDIVSTHALFEMADKELIDLIASNNYTLVLDEVMNVISQVPIKKDDLGLLIDNEILSVDDGGLVSWNDAKDFKHTTFNYIRNMAKNKNIFIHNGLALMWTFPVSCFKSFKETYVLTYMFEAQIQKYYYDMHGVEYEYLTLKSDSKNYKIIPKTNTKENRKRFEKLITLYDGNLNTIGDSDKNSLSSTWLKNNSGNNTLSVRQLQKNIYNYFTNIVKGNSKNNMWTTLLHSKDKLKGRGYTRGFVSHNCRATNDYSHKTNLVYAMNKFMMPIEKSFLESKDVQINQEMWALSELIQWIWRSAIRNNEPINLYIPSERMRGVFIKWLNNIE